MTSKSNLVINPQRLWDSLMETAKFGGTVKGRHQAADGFR